jgi:hypothetical protein
MPLSGDSPPPIWADVQMDAFVGTIQIEKNDFQVTVYVSENIASGVIKDFKGGISLTVENSDFAGNSDLTARQEINLKSEFHAANGSEVHIYPSETFPDCIDYSSYLMQKHGKSTTTINEDSNYNNNEIEIKFGKTGNTISVFPNPSSGIFSIRLNSKNYNDALKLVKVYSPLGKEIYFSSINAKSYQLDLSSYPKGIYFILVNDSGKTYYQRLIIK